MPTSIAAMQHAVMLAIVAPICAVLSLALGVITFIATRRRDARSRAERNADDRWFACLCRERARVSAGFAIFIDPHGDDFSRAERLAERGKLVRREHGRYEIAER